MMMSIPSKLSDCKPEGEGEVPCSNDSQIQTVVNELKSVSPKSSSPPPLKRKRRMDDVDDVKGKVCLCITNLLSLSCSLIFILFNSLARRSRDLKAFIKANDQLHQGLSIEPGDGRNGVCSDVVLHGFNDGIRKACIEVDVSRQQISNMKEYLEDVEEAFEGKRKSFEYYDRRLEIKNRLHEVEAKLKDAVLRRVTMEQRKTLYQHCKYDTLCITLRKLLTDEEDYEMEDLCGVEFERSIPYLSTYLQEKSGKTHDELDEGCKLTWCDCFNIDCPVYSGDYHDDINVYDAYGHGQGAVYTKLEQ